MNLEVDRFARPKTPWAGGRDRSHPLTVVPTNAAVADKKAGA